MFSVVFKLFIGCFLVLGSFFMVSCDVEKTQEDLGLKEADDDEKASCTRSASWEGSFTDKTTSDLTVSGVETGSFEYSRSHGKLVQALEERTDTVGIPWVRNSSIFAYDSNANLIQAIEQRDGGSFYVNDKNTPVTTDDVKVAVGPDGILDQQAIPFTYTYDEQNRIQTATREATFESYLYDKKGNRYLELRTTQWSSTQYTYDSKNFNLTQEIYTVLNFGEKDEIRTRDYSYSADGKQRTGGSYKAERPHTDDTRFSESGTYTYTYDEKGNPTQEVLAYSRTETSGKGTPAEKGITTQYRETNTASYDDKGNMLSKTALSEVKEEDDADFLKDSREETLLSYETTKDPVDATVKGYQYHTVYKEKDDGNYDYDTKGNPIFKSQEEELSYESILTFTYHSKDLLATQTSTSKGYENRDVKVKKVDDKGNPTREQKLRYESSESITMRKNKELESRTSTTKIYSWDSSYPWDGAVTGEYSDSSTYDSNGQWLTETNSQKSLTPNGTVTSTESVTKTATRDKYSTLETESRSWTETINNVTNKSWTCLDPDLDYWSSCKKVDSDKTDKSETFSEDYQREYKKEKSYQCKVFDDDTSTEDTDFF
ncbi:hypothetical protein WDW89_23140 [Deltaproteobacteria bacterium TL4]